MNTPAPKEKNGTFFRALARALSCLTEKDNSPSTTGRVRLPVAGGPGWLGMAFVFNSRKFGKQFFGTSGNSYVGVIEFGPRVQARSIVFFGQSSDPASPHSFDQAPLYARGAFKPAWFHRDEVLANAKATYHPGERK